MIVGNERYIGIGDAALKFCWCPPGWFNQPTRGTSLFYKTEVENVSVEFTSGFWVTATPLTWAQWMKVISYKSYESLAEKLDYPVVGLDLSDVKEFLQVINEMDLLQQGLVFDLPNYLQSRYMCYAKTAPDEEDYWKDRDFGEFAWYLPNSDLSVHPVGLKRPSVWGLYDTFGNVSEMSFDVKAAIGQTVVIDPVSALNDSKFFCSAGGNYMRDYEECVEFENDILMYSNEHVEDWGMRLIIREKLKSE